MHSKVFEAAHSLYRCLYIIPFISVSVGKSGMQDMGDSILSRPIGAIGKLEWVSLVGDGGAHDILDKPLKNLRNLRHKCHWSRASELYKARIKGVQFIWPEKSLHLPQLCVFLQKH